MPILLGILAVIFIVFGILMILFPEGALEIEDMFRVDGERVYSDLAIMMMRFKGAMLIVLSLIGGYFIFITYL